MAKPMNQRRELKMRTLALMATVCCGFGFLPVTVSAQNVDINNVNAVGFYNGLLIRVSGGAWIEDFDSGIQYTFDEIPTTDGFLYLNDTTRNLQLAIDPNAGAIFVSENQTPFEQVYMVTQLYQTPVDIRSTNPDISSVQAYSCNEGIPLFVRFDNSAEMSYADISHDSSNWYRLKIAVSGSGVRYESNGISVHVDENTAIIDFNGSEDICEI